LERAVLVTCASVVSPISLAFALAKYGGNSSRKMIVGSPLSKLIHAVVPGALKGE